MLFVCWFRLIVLSTGECKQINDQAVTISSWIKRCAGFLCYIQTISPYIQYAQQTAPRAHTHTRIHTNTYNESDAITQNKKKTSTKTNGSKRLESIH